MAKSKSQEIMKDPRASFVISLLLFITSYVFVSWAIDSGVMLWYILTFVALYYAFSYLKKFIKLQFFNNGKSRKAKKA